ncbi:NUDIX domain-containing protein [Vibrio hepatarius]|jgi:ADP-ribose pyrophosphatase YjhB (NUDIX family)|uniref:Pyrophosphatase n=1 Tax=Vibrio hepatarius TaxID=171383 RepID=A0A0M0I2U6_9VIBR|nr:NUDIX domain-containing protein [Vibrio hepatarius]KOO08614.1 pyrophosphatase [Vibrio hepatarius]
MEHRIRAAGILIEEDVVLLVKVKDFSGEYWILPGGGMEQGDTSTKACLKREFFEETGLDVEVGELLCVREFLETSKGRYNAEFFYQVTGYRGEIHIQNLKGLSDEEYIQAVEWVRVTELPGKRLYPVELQSRLLTMIEERDYSTHLGAYVQGEFETINYLDQ